MNSIQTLEKFVKVTMEIEEVMRERIKLLEEKIRLQQAIINILERK